MYCIQNRLAVGNMTHLVTAFSYFSARRTMVYDDESDYFDTGANPWLAKEEKEKLRKRHDEIRALQNLPRSQRKVTLDIAGRQVIEVSFFYLGLG